MKKLKPYIKDFTKKADMLLFVLCMMCAVFGIIVISSAAASLGSPRYVLVQTVSLLVGIGLFVLFTVVDIDIIVDKWPVIIIFETLLTLLLLTPLGYADNTGNRAWLRFGFAGIQPAEVNKILFIMVLAKQINYLKNYKNLNAPISIGQLFLHCLYIIGLIVVVSKDMGSALIYLFIFIVMLFTFNTLTYGTFT